MSKETESLAQFIARRIDELDQFETALREKIATINLERDQLNRAALAAGLPKKPSVLAVKSGSLVQKGSTNAKFTIGRIYRRTSEKTMKEAVIEVLEERGHGLTAAEILPEVNSLLNADYVRSSLSPQLSRLKAENVLRREGKVWSLTVGSENDKAAGQTSEEDEPAALFPNSPAKGREAGPGGST